MTCPLCDAPARMLEQLAGIMVRRFCNGCGYVFRLSEAGELAAWQPTNHKRDARRPLLPRFKQPSVVTISDRAK